MGQKIILASQYYIKGCAVIAQLLVIPLFIIVRYPFTLVKIVKYTYIQFIES